MLKQQLGIPVLVTLQGDDVFLDELAEPYKSQAFDEIRQLVRHIDGFIVNSRYYADFMADYFSIPSEQFHVVPLGIDTRDFRDFLEDQKPARDDRPPTVGYLARIAPEKGLHILVDAFIRLRNLEGMQDARLHIAGWLGENNRGYLNSQLDKLKSAGLEDAVQYVGEVDRATKIEFLSNIDVLSVPSTYRDPKGLYVLEAAAAAVSVVQPEHGAFPELIDSLACGRLVRPDDPQQLADQVHQLLSDHQVRAETGRRACKTVHERFNADRMAHAVLEVYRLYARQ